ncbi:MAG TPA: hypothetical protein VFV08_07350 [Puia sp.]|nr:hypothetical protein [Puia sp.]
MKKFLCLSLILSLIIVAVCCNKGSVVPNNNNSNNNNNNNNNGNNGGNPPNKNGIPTPPGIPTGASTSKFIPSTGGSLTTADGKMEIDIPSGALPSGDTITIQNMMNFAWGGVGEAYNFLPNGLKFSTPVTIKYHYNADDMKGASPIATRIAYQDSSGLWRGLRMSTADTVNQVISVSTNHFTEYSLFDCLFISPGAGGNVQDHKIMVTKSNDWDVVLITISDATSGSSSTGSPDDDLLAPPYSVGQAEIDGWSVNGIQNGNSIYGTIAGHGTTATYTAPAQVPNANNPVDISVKLKNISFKTNVTVNGQATTQTFNSLQLNDQVTIIPNDYVFDVVIKYDDTEVDGGIFERFGAIDNAELTVEVKDGTNVTVTVVSNGNTSVIPASQTDNGCISTYTSGEVMNITGGTGTVTDVNPSTPAIVNVILQGSGVTDPLFTLSGTCSGTVGGYAVVGTPPGAFGFALADSTQYPSASDGSVTISVKPKH